jgi:FkbM family methyltransferase
MLKDQSLESNRRRATELLRRFRFVKDLRPAALGSTLIRLLGPEERRTIIEAANGLRVYVDPFTHLGRTLLTDGVFEPETEALLRKGVEEAGVFLDIGANEGYFSALLGTVVGPKGLVIAIEPQSRLQSLIELNLRLNDVRRYRIYPYAFGGEDGAKAQIHLWPTHNTGASSMQRRYRFSRRAETVEFVSLDRILRECGVDHIDMVKIDVEGFEGQVVKHLLPHLKSRRIGSLLLDYHRQILDPSGVDAHAIHREIVNCGYELTVGDVTRLDSYQLYSARRS